jgi:hypothetical protein
VAVEVDGGCVEGADIGEAALLTGVAVCRRRDCLVVRFHMAAKLYPELPLPVEAQQHLGQVGSQHEAVTCQVLGAAVPIQGRSLPFAHEGLVLAAEAHLGGRHRRPLLESVEDLAVGSGHL